MTYQQDTTGGGKSWVGASLAVLALLVALGFLVYMWIDEDDMFAPDCGRGRQFAVEQQCADN